MSVRVRFAPSPTGYLHIGGARTALFNYLFAKKNKGKFILRIEDTDKERSTEESIKVILESLKWLKLFWDEGPEVGGDYGPYFQSQRYNIYKKYINKLLEEKKAYKCYCTKEELDREREEAKKNKIPYKYSGKCRNAGEKNLPYTVRIKVDQEGETIINDLIRGKVVFKNSVLDDFIIARQDGTPTYNFVVAVDDALMNITHVIRGEDHLSNTPKQIQIYKALGFKIPQFAHIPLILGKDKSRLSKRHGATSVTEYKEKGFLSDAFINYLALLGWSYDDTQTIFSREELIEKFSLDRIHKAGAMFDNDKLIWMNGVYIREKISEEEFVNLCIPYLKKDNLITDDDIKNNFDYIKKVILLEKERIKVLSEISENTKFFFLDAEKVDMDEKAKKVWEKNIEYRKKVLEVMKNIIENFGTKKEMVEEKLREEMEKNGIKPKIFMHVLRVVLTGQTTGPGLFDIIETLGKDESLKRIQKYL